jgi:hypothetical protein
MLSLELIDFICEKINKRKLAKLATIYKTNCLYFLNKKRLKKYWRETRIFKLIKYKDVIAIKYRVSTETVCITDALSIACEYGSLKIIKYIESLGVHIATDSNIIIACQHGQLRTVKYLRKKGANIGAKDDMPCIYACIFGHVNILDYLVRKGVRPNTQMLERACIPGHLNIVKYLMLHGVEVTVQALSIIKYYKHEEILSLVMQDTLFG